MKLSIVIPVYNEERTLSSLLETVLLEAKQLEGISNFELVIVEDGSKDQTREVLKAWEGKDHIKVFYQPFNQGKGAAITRGFQQSTGDFVLIQDADCEYDPKDYKVLLRPLLEGKADVVYGSRFKGETTRVLYYWHYLGNTFLTLLSNMFTNLNLTDMETCYKVFSGPLIRSMVLTSKRFGIEPEMTAKVSKVRGIRIYEVPISYYGRTYEEGKKIGWKDGVAAFWFIFKYNILTSFEESFRVIPPLEKSDGVDSSGTSV